MADPVFDPNQPYTVEPAPAGGSDAAPTFDPTQPYTVEPQQGRLSSFLHGAAAGVSANFSDELRGGLYEYFGGSPEGAEHQEELEKQAQRAGQQQHPGYYGTGEFAGAVAPAALGLISGQPEVEAAAAPGLTEGAGLLAQTGHGLLSGAVQGAGYGALAGAGEGTDLQSRLHGAESGAISGGILGGGIGAAAPAAGRAVSATLNALRPLTEKGQSSIAADALREGVNNPETLANIESGNVPGEIIPGSRPTTGEATGDIGLLQMQRRATVQDNTPFIERAQEQEAARRAALRNMKTDADPMAAADFFSGALDRIDQRTNARIEDIQRQAREHTASLGEDQDAATAGMAARAAVSGAFGRRRALNSQLFDAVDPDGTMNLVMAGVKRRAEILAATRKMQTPLSGVENRIFGQVAEMDPVEPFTSARDLMENINAAMRAEMRSAGRSPTWGRLSQLKSSTQSAIDHAIANQDAYERARVAAGEMRPEDTIRARLGATYDDFARGEHAAGNAEMAAAATAGREAGSVPDLYPESGGQNGRSGNAAGRQGLSQGVPRNQASEAVAPQAKRERAWSFGEAVAKGHRNYGRGLEWSPSVAHLANQKVKLPSGQMVNLVRRPGQKGGMTLGQASEFGENLEYPLVGDVGNPNAIGRQSDWADALEHLDREFTEGNPLFQRGHEFERTEREREQGEAADIHDEAETRMLARLALRQGGYGELDRETADVAEQYLMDHPELRDDPAGVDKAVHEAVRKLDAVPDIAADEAAARQASDFPGDRPMNAREPLRPNFRPEQAQALRRANENYADYARTYKQGPVGSILKSTGHVGDYLMPDSAVPGALALKGPKGAETAEAVLRAGENHPDILNAMTDRAFSPLRRALRDDGTFRPGAYQNWRRDYAPLLRVLDQHIPGFSERYSSADRLQEALVQAGRDRQRELTAFNKSAAGRLVGMTSPVEVENHIGNLFKSPTKLLNLRNEANGDALLGLREAGVDWMMRRLSSATENGTSEEMTLNAANFQKFVRNNRAGLEALYGHDTVNTFDAIARDLVRGKRVLATNIKGSPGTAKDLLADIDRLKGRENISFATIVGVGTAAALHFHFGLAAKALTVELARHFWQKARSAGLHNANEVLRDALLNPNRARLLLREFPVDKKGPIGPYIRSLMKSALTLGSTNIAGQMLNDNP